MAPTGGPDPSAANDRSSENYRVNRHEKLSDGRVHVLSTDPTGSLILLRVDKSFFLSLHKILKKIPIPISAKCNIAGQKFLYREALSKWAAEGGDVASIETEDRRLIATLPFEKIHLHTVKSLLVEASATGKKQERGTFVTTLDVDGWGQDATPSFERKGRELHVVAFLDHLTAAVSRTDMRRCENCAQTFVNKHTCHWKVTRFFQKLIGEHKNARYKSIPFRPITSPPGKSLHIIYDLETFTQYTRSGKRLLPFMIAFALRGDAELVEMGKSIARAQGYDYDPHTENFYSITRNHDGLVESFRTFREEISLSITDHFWRALKRAYDLGDDYEACDPEALKRTMKKLRGRKDLPDPLYYNVLVLGHNISGFDEVVMWSHLTGLHKLEERYPQFTWRRLFLPRGGKILFDDVTCSVPNPSYENPSKPEAQKKLSERWRKGEERARLDYQWQGLNIKSRDTYLLTHASLRAAAKAYGLPLEKGECPYEAVNEFVRQGTYEQEENGFPVEKYWQNKEDYLENRKRHAGGKYDIVRETLKYCLRDVSVTCLLVEKLFLAYSQFYKENVVKPRYHVFDVFKRPTVSSNTHALFKQTLYLEKGVGNHLPGLVAPTDEGYELVRKSIKGGRCYPTFLGIFERPTFVYDVCGMYASALTHPLPYGVPLKSGEAGVAIAHLQSLLDRPLPIDYFDASLKPCIVRADCTPPPLEKLDVLPPMCVKTDEGGLMWTNETIVDETLTSLDLITLHNRGWRCSIRQETDYVVWPAWECVCAKYVKINIEAKEKATVEKNETMRSLAKLLSNALYGSFATKMENKKTVLGDPVADRADADGWYVDSLTYLNFNAFQKERIDINPREYAVSARSARVIDDDKQKDVKTPTFAFIDADENDLTAYTLKKTGPVENERYATQIASFVLAWTRAFISEWASFLYDEDRETPIEKRPVKSIYGDTDSIFLTERGRECFIRYGAHRIKGHKEARLIYDPSDPKLAWAAECETVCDVCGADAYAPRSVYLAPKVYALAPLRCTSCPNDKIAGKVKAKGHNKRDITFDSLVKCYLWNETKSERMKPQNEDSAFKTSRRSIKRTMIQGDDKNVPMTLKEVLLSRTLEPWKNPRLRKETDRLASRRYGNGDLMYPFDEAHPSPKDEANGERRILLEKMDLSL
ncbi:DNA polymerase [Barthadenovirus mellis]|uniref:DNA polymerase n=1 Tax=Passerine adenovirus 1 TaxID=2779174 RepID=A0A7L9DIQ4_9ADEN|nr:DNA polymerase [Passerine adenovirus 1]